MSRGSGRGVSGPMDGDLAGPRTEAGQRRPVGQRHLDLPVACWTSTLRGAGSRAGGWQASGPSGTSISAPIGQERRVPTLQGGESPMPGSGCPVVPRDGGRNVAGPSASNAGQRPVSRRQALAYGSSLASVTVVPPRGCDRLAFRTSTATLAQGGGRRSGPARLDRRSRLSLAGRVGTLPRNRPNPQEASNDGTDPVRAARWCLRYRSGG
jgi:hypothetical protein